MVGTAQFNIDTGDPLFAVVHLAGRLDMAGTGAVELPFGEAVAAHGNLAVDLSRVDYISSVGLRLLMLAARALGRRGGRLVVTNPHPHAAQVLQVAGLERLVSIVPEGGAAAAFDQPPAAATS
jgi:anti-anti-sigma factor